MTPAPLFRSHPASGYPGFRAALATCVMVVGVGCLVGCNDQQRLFDYGSLPADAGDTAGADTRPDASVIVDGPSPWEWAEEQDTILAPWVHKLDEQLAAQATVEADRLVFGADANPDALDYRRHDLVWASSASAEHSFLRRVLSVTESGDDIVIETADAQLDELFFKGAFSQSAFGDTNDDRAKLDVDESMETSEPLSFAYCQLTPDGPIDTCESFSEVDEHGDFIDPPVDPSAPSSALIFAAEFDTSARLRAEQVVVDLQVGFFERADTKCACAVQHYPDYQAIARRCAITSVESDVPEAVDDLKPQCRADIERLQVEMKTRSDVALEDLVLRAPKALTHSTPLAEVGSFEAAAEIPGGWLNLMVSLETAVEFDVDDRVSVEWIDDDSRLDVRLDAQLGYKWPRGRDDETPLPSMYAVDVQRSIDEEALGPIRLDSGREAHAKLVSRLVVHTKLWGADGPTAIPLGVATEVGSDIDTIDGASECALYQRAGSFVGLDFDRGFPLTFIEPSAPLRQLEGCAKTQAGEIPGVTMGACSETDIRNCDYLNRASHLRLLGTDDTSGSQDLDGIEIDAIWAERDGERIDAKSVIGGSLSKVVQADFDSCDLAMWPDQVEAFDNQLVVEFAAPLQEGDTLHIVRQNGGDVLSGTDGTGSAIECRPSGQYDVQLGWLAQDDWAATKVDSAVTKNATFELEAQHFPVR